MAKFIVASVRPKALATARSLRRHARSPARNSGREISTNTIVDVARRRVTTALGGSSSNNRLANPAPSCTEMMPSRTSAGAGTALGRITGTAAETGMWSGAAFLGRVVRRLPRGDVVDLVVRVPLRHRLVVGRIGHRPGTSAQLPNLLAALP
jgi:hypothetical protein